MDYRNIIVIGASAGGFDAIKKLTSVLPADLHAAIFVVWHMAPDLRGVLPGVLNRLKTIPARHAVDEEPIAFNNIYVARPDWHLMLEPGKVRVTHGPKENRFRPAVDPLFRSAAFSYGPRVIGIVLSGALDDGTAGLAAIKRYGGVAIVQSPNEAEVPSMPMSAVRQVNVDHIVGVNEMGSLIASLCREEVEQRAFVDLSDREQLESEMQIALAAPSLKLDIGRYGSLSPYTCPECNGVLFKVRDKDVHRYRCHTGHAFSSDSLLAILTERIEDGLWGAVRAMQESIFLLQNLGDHYATINEPKTAALYFKKATDAQSRVDLVRQAVLLHEQLSDHEVMSLANKSAPNA